MSDFPSQAQGEVLGLAADLIRINTTNTGDSATLHPERPAAEYAAEKLSEVGISSQLIESDPGRTSLIAHIPGTDPDAPGLVLHGHLDVVPAFAEEWSVPPFAGEVIDGYLWGRGAVDMKNMDAMILAVLRAWARNNIQPRRSIVLAFFPDEEAGSLLGSWHIVKNHPELFEGCTEAISEVGGFSLTVRGKRIYPIQTAEKGMSWVRLRAEGRAGHGSLINRENAITRLSLAVAEIGKREQPASLRAPVRELLRVISEVTGVFVTTENADEALAELGTAAAMIGATLRTTANPTQITGGYKANVIPSTAEAIVDLRFLPGEQETFLSELQKVVSSEITLTPEIILPALEAPFDTPLFDTMVSALTRFDPSAVCTPYMMSGGTDAKALASLGIHGYGFSPLQLPAEFDFMSMFHGVDERVPVDALTFGTHVLDTFLQEA